MKITSFWGFIALLAPPALAATESTATSATSTATAPTCTASLITKLCDYPSAGPIFSVASSGYTHCWEYCNAHPPCDFVIFIAGNPYTGTGSCSLYPGETFDESKGDTDCGNPVYSVYDKPECSGGSPTTTAGACAATASPSAIASGCGYPAPDDNCWSTCSASAGAVDCLSQCAEADSCDYVIFNPHNWGSSQYASGSCWMYTNGTSFDESSMSTCDGDAEQYAYKNVCPKPKTTSSASVSASASSLSSGTALAASGTDGPSSNGTAGSPPASTASSESSAPGGAARLPFRWL